MAEVADFFWLAGLGVVFPYDELLPLFFGKGVEKLQGCAEVLALAGVEQQADVALVHSGVFAGGDGFPLFSGAEAAVDQAKFVTVDGFIGGAVFKPLGDGLADGFGVVCHVVAFEEDEYVQGWSLAEGKRKDHRGCFGCGQAYITL